jgi:hypothetical protein
MRMGTRGGTKQAKKGAGRPVETPGKGHANEKTATKSRNEQGEEESARREQNINVAAQTVRKPAKKADK